MIPNHAHALLLSSKSNRSAKKMKSPEGKTLADVTQYSNFLVYGIHMLCAWGSNVQHCVDSYKNNNLTALLESCNTLHFHRKLNVYFIYFCIWDTACGWMK